jgi:Transglycosylase SLT domain/D-alanyl-D-alanine carboxypeptidase
MTRRAESGQALLVLLGALLLVLAGSVVLGTVASGLGGVNDRQRAADLAALSAARQMQADYSRLFEAPRIDGRTNPRWLSKQAYLDRAVAAGRATAARNGRFAVAVSFPDGRTFAPVLVRAVVRDPVVVRIAGRRHATPVRAAAEAELAPPNGAPGDVSGVGEYPGPFAHRQGKPMRPDVAAGFDRMNVAATRAGHPLLVVSAFRSNAEQARLFAAHPDPKWVAPPGRSLHRLATELDLGPDAAWPWLDANAGRFHFVRRYAWEPWHFGWTLNAGSKSVGFGGERGGSALPSFVPAEYAPLLSHAASRWNVSAALLAAQLYAESGFNPYAQSGAGAEGIAQFMPGTALAYGLTDPYDAEAAIDAQGHLMRDLLRQFGAVPLALAAYNAGPKPVQACGCVPQIPETIGYVARILGLLGGAGDASVSGGLIVRLVE